MNLFCDSTQATTQATSIHWYTNYQEAATVAKSSSKPMLLLFTGSDWCGACKELEKKVFDSKEFAGKVGNKVIFVKLDYPKGKAQDQTIKTQNNQLMKKYQVPYYPYVILLNDQEMKIGTIEDRSGPDRFAQEIIQKAKIH